MKRKSYNFTYKKINEDLSLSKNKLIQNKNKPRKTINQSLFNHNITTEKNITKNNNKKLYYYI